MPALIQSIAAINADVPALVESAKSAVLMLLLRSKAVPIISAHPLSLNGDVVEAKYTPPTESLS